jgi:hypothetical protein
MHATEAATEFSAVSWLLLACLAALVVVGVVSRDRWQRWWFELEDPRSIAAFRIAFSFLLICNVNGLAEWFDLLFLPTGMFTADEARDAFAVGVPEGRSAPTRVHPAEGGGTGP